MYSPENKTHTHGFIGLCARVGVTFWRLTTENKVQTSYTPLPLTSLPDPFPPTLAAVPQRAELSMG